MSNFSLVDEWGQLIDIYPHRLVFLVPRLVSESTPPTITKGLNFIADSLDGESTPAIIQYPETLFQEMLVAIQRQAMV